MTTLNTLAIHVTEVSKPNYIEQYRSGMYQHIIINSTSHFQPKPCDKTIAIFKIKYKPNDKTNNQD